MLLPAFVEPDGTGSVLRRGVPARRVGGHLVTTVYDLMLAQYGVDRDRVCRASGRPATTTSPTPYTPAWQAEITGVPAEQCIRIAREFATNAEESQGRSMIIMGAGICQWFHGDATYRAILVAAHPHRLHGPQRRRLGALRRPGEVPADHRLDLPRQRPRLDAGRRAR